MKRIIVFLVSLFIIFNSCTTTQNDEQIELGENMQSKPMETCNCDSLELNGELLSFEGTIFTGLCFLNYPMSDQRYVEKQILDGKIHGNVVYYDKNDNVLFEEMYINGVQDKNEDYCNCSDLVVEQKGEIKKNYLNGKPFTGKCEDFFLDTEQVYLEANYIGGQLDGFVNYYSKNGNVVMIQKYELGEYVKDIVPSN
jgi:hypothetical protein